MSTVPENAPEHCPGTESEAAGKAEACAGCPNQSICSALPRGPDPAIEEIKVRLAGVKHKVSFYFIIVIHICISLVGKFHNMALNVING